MKTTSIALLLSMIAGVHASQADTLTYYNVNAVFNEPMLTPATSSFKGSFILNSTTNQITNLSGTLIDGMNGMQTILSYQNTPSVSDGNGGILATVFALNTTDVFSQGGYDPTKGQKTFGNNNAYMTIDVNAANPLLGATNINLILYADCTPSGLMGTTCMTGRAGGGTMMGVPQSETITINPAPSISLKGTSVTISLAVSDNDDMKTKADWWIMAYTPSKQWYYLMYPNQWVLLGSTLNQSAMQPAYQGLLRNLTNMTLVDTTGLPTGNYIVYFGVDTSMNGVLDSGSGQYYSSWTSFRIK